MSAVPQNPEVEAPEPLAFDITLSPDHHVINVINAPGWWMQQTYYRTGPNDSRYTDHYRYPVTAFAVIQTPTGVAMEALVAHENGPGSDTYREIYSDHRFPPDEEHLVHEDQGGLCECRHPREDNVFGWCSRCAGRVRREAGE